MGASETACVIYMFVVLAAVFGLIHRWARAGKLCWNTLNWNHITHDARGFGPTRFGLLRLAMSAYGFTTFFAMALEAPDCLATFTVWSWGLISLYLGVAGTCSLMEGAKQSPDGGLNEEVTRSRGKKVLSCILWVWFEAVFSTAILIFLIVWLVLLPFAYISTGTDGKLLRFLPLSAHNLNIVFMGTEMMVNRLAFVPAHALFVMLYGITYVIFSWFYFLFQRDHKFWYFFLDWRHSTTPVWYTILIAIIWAAFAGGQRISARVKAQLASELPGSARDMSWPAANITNEGHLAS